MTSGTHSLQSGGTQRSYILRLPANYDSSHPHRLIFGIHWFGGSASYVANGNMIQPFYGLQALANNSTLFVAPQGLTSGGLSGWPNTGGQDVTFIDNIIRTIEADLCIDTSQRRGLQRHLTGVELLRRAPRGARPAGRPGPTGGAAVTVGDPNPAGQKGFVLIPEGSRRPSATPTGTGPTAATTRQAVWPHTGGRPVR
ncbi:hypothetical protein [Plantactinospora sp. KLBMP9567]|uniref:hypothetical protein n=1 Tax=Plantactinospora sp. KLBMP9567 TaxID=3085900 RepID=UPI0029812672|nr:hypothetical protein [Plantactinospora sp. KLBMP9567]MDW5330273.1 hypothetical protein [Plantactinospora sp. KLBMP9567]